MLFEIDKFLFYLINKSIKNPLFDAILPLFARHEDWLLVAIFLVAYMIYIDRERGVSALIMAVLAVTVTDLMIHNGFKPFFGRVRPCNFLEAGTFNLMVGCGDSFSFPSQHASNIFAIAGIIGFKFKKSIPYLFTIAFFVALSRVYVGVHYPFDVTAGAIFGLSISFLIILIEKKWQKKNSIHSKK